MYPKTVLRRSKQRLEKIAPSNSKLAFERVVCLPTDLAVLYSAVQNFRLDLAKGYHRGLDVWETVQASYFWESSDLMLDQGANHYPGDNDEPWIQVRHRGSVKFPKERAIKLKQVFDVIFQRNDTNLLDSEFYPTPLNCVTMAQIKEFHGRIIKRFITH